MYEKVYQAHLAFEQHLAQEEEYDEGEPNPEANQYFAEHCNAPTFDLQSYPYKP